MKFTMPKVNPAVLSRLQVGKRGKLWLLTLGAVGCGVVAAFAAKGYLSQELAAEKAKLSPKTPMVRVVVAKQELPKGTVISMENLAVRAIPKDFVAGSAIAPERIENYIGAKLNVGLRSGESLLASQVDGADISTFASKVKPGIRAITVSVDEVASVSGMVQPGDRIDLLWSVKPAALKLGDGQDPEQTVVFMQDVKVLATGKQVRPATEDQRQRSYTTVTLEATSTQAQQLVVAQRSGKLTALLRNPEDTQPLDKKGTDLSHLLSLRPGTVEKPVSTAAAVIPAQGPEVLVGGKGDLNKQRQAKLAMQPVQEIAPAASKANEGGQ
jgi:pilus assembly protein CpaB